MSGTSSEQLLKIGLSLPFREYTQLQEVRDIPECFEFLELTGELISHIVQLRSENELLQEFEAINFRDLLPPSLTAQLPAAGKSIVYEYKKTLRELFAQAYNCHAQTVSLDPDWEALANNPDARKIFNDVLCSTAGDREYYNLILSLSVRIPHTGSRKIAEFVHLLHQLSSHRVQAVLDINPHEMLNSPIDWQQELQMFRFCTSHVRFCYPSELGNKLLYKHIEPVITALKKYQRKITVYIAPSGRADLGELAAMVNEITGESELL